MLDDEERSVLEETERALARNDPALVRLMREGPRPRRWVQVAAVLVTLAVVVGLMSLRLLGEALLVALVVAGLFRAVGRLAALGYEREPCA